MNIVVGGGGCWGKYSSSDQGNGDERDYFDHQVVVMVRLFQR